ncbi:MAG: lysophospholipid acyltransferase family protein [Alphaproteobacteria bacterium]|nr:lysophospholipid acyltransferase family protein [Alphaproteobacteria bacterium]
MKKIFNLKKQLVLWLYRRQKKILKFLFALPFISSVAAYLVVGLLMFVYYTSRVKFTGAGNIRKTKNKPVIYACWHGRLLIIPMIALKYKARGYAIASRSRDGQLIAKIQKPFGIKSIHGSTGRSGAIDVLRSGLRILKEGKNLGLTPDGPRGPHMKVHDGILYFAKMSGAPILPISASANRAWFENVRWDKFMIMYPFSRIHIDVAEPFYVGKKEDIDVARARLEKVMQEQAWMVDAKFGRPKQEVGKPKVKK